MTKKKKSNELGKKSKSLMDKYKRKLDGAKFRILNEKLYTTSGNIAFKMFQKDPELFEIVKQSNFDSIIKVSASRLRLGRRTH